MRTLKRKCRRKNGGTRKTKRTDEEPNSNRMAYSRAAAAAAAKAANSRNTKRMAYSRAAAEAAAKAANSRKSERIAAYSQAAAKQQAKAAAEQAKAAAAEQAKQQAKAAAKQAKAAAAQPASQASSKRIMTAKRKINLMLPKKEFLKETAKLFQVIHAPDTTSEMIQSASDEFTNWYIEKSEALRDEEIPPLTDEEKEGIQKIIGMYLIRQLECEKTNFSEQFILPDYITIERNAVSDGVHRKRLTDFWGSDEGNNVKNICFGIKLDDPFVNGIPYALSNKAPVGIIDGTRNKSWVSGHIVQAAWVKTGGSETKAVFEIESDNLWVSLLGYCQIYGPGNTFPISNTINKDHRNITRQNSLGVDTGLASHICGFMEMVISYLRENRDKTKIDGHLDSFSEKSKEVYLKEILFNTAIERILSGKIKRREASCFTKQPLKHANTTMKVIKKCLEQDSETIAKLAIDVAINPLSQELCQQATKTAQYLTASKPNPNTNQRRFAPAGCSGPTSLATSYTSIFLENKELRTAYTTLLQDGSITPDNIYLEGKLSIIKAQFTEEMDKIILAEEDKLKEMKILIDEAEKKEKEMAKEAFQKVKLYEEQLKTEKEIIEDLNKKMVELRKNLLARTLSSVNAKEALAEYKKAFETILSGIPPRLLDELLIKEGLPSERPFSDDVLKKIAISKKLKELTCEGTVQENYQANVESEGSASGSSWYESNNSQNKNSVNSPIVYYPPIVYDPINPDEKNSQNTNGNNSPIVFDSRPQKKGKIQNNAGLAEKPKPVGPGNMRNNRNNSF